MISTQVFFDKIIFLASGHNMIIHFDSNGYPLKHPLADKKIVTNDN